MDNQKQRVQHAIWVSGIFLFAMWIPFILDFSFDLNLYRFGVYPRSLEGIPGILFSPFIHALKDDGTYLHNLAHIVNNSVPIAVLMSLLAYFYREVAIRVLVGIILLGGMCVWISARQNYHIGASGVVYGLVTFLFLSGTIRKHRSLMGVSMLVAFLYGSIVWGVLPMFVDVSTSYEGHFWGAVSGLALGYYYRKEGTQRPKYLWEMEEEFAEKKGLEEEVRFNPETGQVLVNYVYKHTSSDNDNGYAVGENSNWSTPSVGFNSYSTEGELTDLDNLGDLGDLDDGSNLDNGVDDDFE